MTRSRLRAMPRYSRSNTKSSASCSVMSWKRSFGGTSIVSTSARWIASPILRRYEAGLPLSSEIRTSGIQCPFQVVHLAALARAMQLEVGSELLVAVIALEPGLADRVQLFKQSQQRHRRLSQGESSPV